jgi:hypothetical protein
LLDTALALSIGRVVVDEMSVGQMIFDQTTWNHRLNCQSFQTFHTDLTKPRVPQKEKIYTDFLKTTKKRLKKHFLMTTFGKNV